MPVREKKVILIAGRQRKRRRDCFQNPFAAVTPPFIISIKTLPPYRLNCVMFSSVERFLKRNPETSIVAEAEGEIIGTILCGHDGRRGCFYHVCVKQGFRKHRAFGCKLTPYPICLYTLFLRLPTPPKTLLPPSRRRETGISETGNWEGNGGRGDEGASGATDK